MIKLGSAYRLNEPSVAAEDLDDEVVIVSFSSGRYYSLRGTGAEAWRLLQAGHDVDSIIAHYSQAGSGVRDSIRGFVHRLSELELIVESETASSPVAALSPAEGFEPPVLEEFDEMKEMLLYDPIHDVDETGWPNLPEPSLRNNE